jgi:hypothetical protein
MKQDYFDVLRISRGAQLYSYSIEIDYRYSLTVNERLFKQQ